MIHIGMKIVLSGVLGCALTSAVLAAPKPLPAPAPAPTKATIGAKAPAFTLTDTDGKAHQLSDYAGKIVVLEWFNAGCPYSGGKANFSVNGGGKSAALRAKLKEVDPNVVYLLIDSSSNRDMATVIADDQKAKKELKIEPPILIDHDGVVGRKYDARTTPHMYVIDSKGVLRYQGAFDDDRKNRKGDEATNHVLDAVKAIKKGEDPSPATTRPWGCSVKYA
ncbi:MAG: redoxin domain-containing protein [Phycisphaerales bacterium]|nr:redoxin domain-containing protein [Phycisphaerales bacterium]